MALQSIYSPDGIALSQADANAYAAATSAAPNPAWQAISDQKYAAGAERRERHRAERAARREARDAERAARAVPVTNGQGEVTGPVNSQTTPYPASGSGGSTNINTPPTTGGIPSQIGGVTTSQSNGVYQVSGGSEATLPNGTPRTEDSATYQSQISTMTPTTINKNVLVTPETMTAQEQLAGILNKNSALMQQSANAGLSLAASRGLLNSSMAVQAAQDSMIRNAAPIAQSDAAAINATRSQNASTLNQAETQNAGIFNTANQFNAQSLNQGNQFNTQQRNAMSQWNSGQQNEAILKQMDVNSREQLANIEANYKQLMQVNSSAESMYNQTMKNIADIQMSDTVADKEAAINSQLAMLNSGMTMVQNLNGVSGLVTF